MLYKIKATYKPNKITEFYAKLNDGSIASQKPDGKEMLNSMQRAKINNDSIVSWYETCFCITPLNHERTTVYDHYFETFTPMLVDKVTNDLQGKSFWEYMKTL